MSDMMDECYPKAIDVLRRNLTRIGFVGAAGIYSNQLWARDSCISILGVGLSGEKDLIKGVERTLNTLKKGQTKLGMMPNFYSQGYFDYGESGCIDTSLWYIIACEFHYRNTQDKKFLKRFWPSIKKAYQWLQYQDQNNLGLLDSQKGGEMVDSSIQRCGKVLYVNTLWYQALKCMKALSKEMKEGLVSDKDLSHVKDFINYMFWPEKKGLKRIPLRENKPLDWSKAYQEVIKPDREHYVMNVAYERWENYFDTMANSLAILFDIANKEKTKRIINYAERRRIAEPFPARCLDPVVMDEKAQIWDINVDLRRPIYWQSYPYQFWNGGVFPFIGAFYILALEKAGKRRNAEGYMKKLVEANKKGAKSKWEFNECLDGMHGKTRGQPYQSWNAGMYIVVHNVINRDIKKVFI